MEWKTLLCPRREREAEDGKTGSGLRSEFEKDYHRIIGSASFRRLQDKTQVFPLDKSDFIRTRLTHSMEVSSLARSLGQMIAQEIIRSGRDETFGFQEKEDISNILQCAGLIHDIGNPPFGHFGEMVIRDWFARRLPEMTYRGKPVSEWLSEGMLQDFYQFEGNAQALRLLCRLHFLEDEYGMNLTYGLLHTILKYPVSSLEVKPGSGDVKEAKLGYFCAEKELVKTLMEAVGTNGARHPLTFILEAADDIAYKTADMEDAFKKGCISYDNLRGELERFSRQCSAGEQKAFDNMRVLGEKYARAEREKRAEKEQYAIQNWLTEMQGFLISCAAESFMAHYEEIMEGSWKRDLFWGTPAEGLMEFLGDVEYRYAFTTQDIYKLEISAARVMTGLMDQFLPAVLSYDVSQDEMGERLIALISDNYLMAYHAAARGKDEAGRLYLRILLLTDFICGMTDSYAKRLYQELNGF